MSFEISIPEKLTFQNYIAVMQTARAWADGYDRKNSSMLLAALAPEVVVDYSLIVPAWGQKAYKAEAFAVEWLSEEHLGLRVLATQHLLALPYFKSVTDEEIVVQWQQLVSHGRREQAVYGGANALNSKIVEESDHRSYMEHRFVKVEERWKIQRITPSLIYATGDFMRVRRPEGEN